MNRKNGSRGSLFGGKNRSEATPGMGFRIRDDFLLPEQLTFFKVLLSAVGDTYLICPQVNLADVFIINDENRNRLQGGGIGDRKIDFMLRDLHSLLPLAGLELSGYRDQNTKSREHEYLLDDIFEAAKLPLIRIFITNSYETESLRESILDAVADKGKALTICSGSPEEGPLKTEQGLMADKAETLSRLKEWPPEPDLHPEESLIQPALSSHERAEWPLFPAENQWESNRPAGEAGLHMPLQQKVTVCQPVQEMSDSLRHEHCTEPDLISLSGIVVGGEEVNLHPEPTQAEPAALTNDDNCTLKKRFMFSQPEQTPGVDFFTGAFIDIQLLPFATEPAEDSAAAEVSRISGPSDDSPGFAGAARESYTSKASQPQELNKFYSGAKREINRAFDPQVQVNKSRVGSDKFLYLPSLDQLKAKMKQ